MKYKFQLFVLIIFSFFILFSGESTKNSIASFFSRFLFLPVVSSFQTLDSKTKLVEENRKLQEMNRELLTQNLAYRDQKLALEKKDLEKRGLQLATVVGVLGNYNQKILILDIGSMQGVKVNTPVFTSLGIVGKVVSTQLNTCQVLPLNNIEFHLSVKSQRTKIQGVLTCSLDGSVFVDMIDFGADVRADDLFITSNLSSVFPEGFSVGHVQFLRTSDYGNRLQAVIKPIVDIANLETVYLLKEGK